MSFFPRPPLYVGIEKTSSFLKIASLQVRRGRWEIVDLKEIPVTSDVKQLDIPSQESICISILESREILSRSLELPLTQDKDIAAALEFQVEPLLPYPIDKAVLQFLKAERQPLGTLITLLSARKDHLQEHLDGLKKLNIEPEIVTAIPIALAALTEELSPTKEALCVVYLGETLSSCLLVQEGKLLASRSFDGDGERLEHEICKSVLAFASSFKNKKISSVLLLGNGHAFAEKLERLIGTPVSVPSHPLLSKDTIQKYGIALGAALASLPKKGRVHFNFRQKEFAYPYPLKRYKKPLLTYFLTMFLCASALFFFGRSYLNRQELELKQHYLSLLSLTETKPEDPQASIVQHSAKELAQNLLRLQEKIGKHTETFPLQPNVPSVSDVLAWLSNHPQIVDENGVARIDIENFDYRMIHLPNLSKKNEHYQLKIKLLFSATSPSAARAFHDALLASNPFVDPKKEVEWNMERGKYSVSFYAKDKTRYP